MDLPDMSIWVALVLMKTVQLVQRLFVVVVARLFPFDSNGCAPRPCAADELKWRYRVPAIVVLVCWQ